ncbi:MAG: hypothetical protein F4Y07_14520 [Gemmatimonadetes bacterium]|nr:hypothetical protein [Gemmatimonadota bacterium]MYE17688.1 hypothetical protein [Gemmatimonadota bacterium]
MSDTSALRDQHARAPMAAQNARRVDGLAVARVVIGLAVPLDGRRVEVIVGRLDGGQSGDRRKLQQERNGGSLPGPECGARPQHAGKGSAADRHPSSSAEAACRPVMVKQYTGPWLEGLTT